MSTRSFSSTTRNGRGEVGEEAEKGEEVEEEAGTRWSLRRVELKNGKKEVERRKYITLWFKKELKRINSHLIIHCPTSEGVSKVSKRTSERSRALKQSE